MLTFSPAIRFTLHPSVSLASVAKQLPFTYTGADFYALCSDAMLKAVTRQATAVDAKVQALNADPRRHQPISTAYFFDHYATKEDLAVMVTEQDFLSAHDELIPSVSAGELAHYEHVRATFEGGRDAQKQQQTFSNDVTAAVGSGNNSRPASSRGKKPNKGKGKAMERDEMSDEEMNGYVNGKSKGKGKAVMAFQEGTASDDDGLY